MDRFLSMFVRESRPSVWHVRRPTCSWQQLITALTVFAKATCVRKQSWSLCVLQKGSRRRVAKATQNTSVAAKAPFAQKHVSRRLAKADAKVFFQCRPATKKHRCCVSFLGATCTALARQLGASLRSHREAKSGLPEELRLHRARTET